LVRELATGSLLGEQRNVVLIGGTDTGKSHLAIAIARAFILRPCQGAVLHRRRSGQPSRK
jgi:DNA replication protein DnaC